MTENYPGRKQRQAFSAGTEANQPLVEELKQIPAE